MRTTALVLGILALLSFSPLVHRAAAQSGCGYPDINAEGAIVLTGNTPMNTRPFDLEARAYTVRWSGKSSDRIVVNNLIFNMHRADGQLFSGLLLNSTIDRGTPEMSGETQVYVQRAGAYYLEVKAPADWLVTISPQV